MRWEFWIDRGGTFTDCLGRDPSTGEIHVAKILSTDRAPIDGIREILGLDGDAPIPPCDIRMGTTVATNALLERKGARTVLVTTRGFRDVLEIGTQARPALFDLDIRKPPVLYGAVLEVDARCAPSGEVLERPDSARALDELRALRGRGFESVAVVFLHAYRHGELELGMGKLAARAGFRHVSLSHVVAPQLGLLIRGNTTVLDAYLTPLLQAYLDGFAADLPGSSLRLMQSGGGLTDRAHFRGPNAILSGPAGGVVAVAEVARAARASASIGFDMGGTSTDVCRVSGEIPRVYELEAAGILVSAPSLDIHTVAAGGGSICRIEGGRLVVGPESARADPGPLAYGRPNASALTITDVNLFLGRIVAERFPFPLDTTRPAAAIDDIVKALASRGTHRTAAEVAQGFLDVANHNMAEAIRKVSVMRGYDVRDHALVVFGGAGGQHACAIARILGIRTLIFHPLAGVLSAYGMGLASTTVYGDADAGRILLEPGAIASLDEIFSELMRRGKKTLIDEGLDERSFTTERKLDLRYRGTETAIAVWPSSEDGSRAAFEREHQRLFGYTRPGEPIELVAAHVETTSHRPVPAHRIAPSKGAPTSKRRVTRLFIGEAFVDDVPVFERDALPRRAVDGPAIVVERTTAIVVEPGFRLTQRSDGILMIEATEPSEKSEAEPGARPAKLDPVRLEILNNRFVSIAEQMGHALERTALSTNIRERLDFSCAIFDEDGSLVSNAPHIPVHLGAMSESVRSVISAHPAKERGDVFVTNDPAGGGSHLPDITVVSPIHDARGRVIFFTASRGHHADVGGITPGSMPPFSRTLAEEGVVLRALRIVRNGQLDEALVLRTLASGPYPARNPHGNVADLAAQIAANRTGARLLEDLVSEQGYDSVRAYMKYVQDDAAESVLETIRRLGTGARQFEDALDDGSRISVRLVVSATGLTIDFSGTGGEHDGNLNAPRAVTTAAIVYVLRTLTRKSIPLNDGCLRHVQVVMPEPSLLAPGPERAVAGGNVETSQRIVDALLACAGAAAASQGTMNNLTFGDDSFGYYETIAGGAGAGPGFAGASAVHTHMTNTRITDVEVLETRFPVRVREFSVRRSSGGKGRFPGGDGVVRELELLRPLAVSILSERRVLAPFGLEGGAPGMRGKNLWNGRDVGGRAAFRAEAGDRIRIETPGGGGYGAAD